MRQKTIEDRFPIEGDGILRKSEVKRFAFIHAWSERGTPLVRVKRERLAD